MIVAKSYGSHEERARARLSPTFTSSDDTLYTIQIFLHSALDMDTRSLDESDVVVDRPLRPASSGMSWRFKTSLGEVYGTWDGYSACLMMMMTQQAIQRDCTLQ